MADGDIIHSRWSFDFQKRTTLDRTIEKQQILPIVPEGCEVALWSGGLDALAGLYTRLQTADHAPFMLFGTGSNPNTHNLQKKVFKALNPYFPNRLNLCRVRIPFSDSKQLIQLYQTYVSEWDAVEPQISVGMLDQRLVTVQSS
ncbi:hypothetical protein [Planktothrix agardhii]|uniref:hypothetical protein n=1 Tax=Planktothrix agardhii TaxID=1160 RepID=UPI000486AC75|nr:hypothetical protein [Planktothrix agardhii]